MTITYDAEANAVYIERRSGTPVDCIDLEDGVTADLDEAGHVLGLEILDARERLGPDALDTVSVQRLLASTG